ncbi:hypothetical protein KDW_22770 [Dictyobacter vulcani]|uniref:N-acetylmuramoyl-L-alanine amidase n=1 Tax=Dictyobacter vulcani TaxID=2607529 RepID=A0A5J4KJW7_9CHLR|nr:peptidoglycan recognition family protein [Dictyobacter vulcani]GER88115.1 hypothetical protein KDW_22770 [Dictyobacter vulcani]
MPIHYHFKTYRSSLLFLLIVILLMSSVGNGLWPRPMQAAYAMSSIEQVFEQSAHEFEVPAPILKALCYLEGRLSNHGGTPSIDDGYGCMHLLAHGSQATLAMAAKDLKVSQELLKTDLATNIRGGAAVLRDDMRLVAGSSRSLDSWYTVLGVYSGASTPDVAEMYADAVYKIVQQGFTATADNGELILLQPQNVRPKVFGHSPIGALARLQPWQPALPKGCAHTGKTDYPGAINCIVNAKKFDCNRVPDKAPCNYEGAKRPKEYPVTFVGIHDIEGSAMDALNYMHNVKSTISVHYIVSSDGTVYQTLHDNDIGYHFGNYWYNQRAVGIEHTGYAATGYQWYNATQYLASAKLTAYLLKKYHIPLDRAHVIGHGSVPAPTVALMPNHVDPGPYWLWGYYFSLINAAGVAYPRNMGMSTKMITVSSEKGRVPLGRHGRETASNYNFFPLYTGPSTHSALAPRAGNDATDETNNIEAGISYAYTNFTLDKAGTGLRMYQIWYGLETHLRDKKSSHRNSARQVWLALPARSINRGGTGMVVLLTDNSKIYSQPGTDDKYQIGDAPKGATFVSGLSVQDHDDDWYEINYNHRQAWISESSIDF